MEVIQYRSIPEWEAYLGEQVRVARIARNSEQAQLAEQANISLGALSNLERGKGSTLKTLVAVVRALDLTSWLEALAPPVPVSPMQMLRSSNKAVKRQRASGVRRASTRRL
jgi:transcriptional regulator with XRE-family HTH domain